MMYMLHATETGSFSHTQLTIQLSHSNVLQAKRAMGGLGHPRLLIWRIEAAWKQTPCSITGGRICASPRGSCVSTPPWPSRCLGNLFIRQSTLCSSFHRGAQAAAAHSISLVGSKRICCCGVDHRIHFTVPIGSLDAIHVVTPAAPVLHIMAVDLIQTHVQYDNVDHQCYCRNKTNDILANSCDTSP